MNAKRWLQKLLGCYGLSPASLVLFKLTTPMYWGGIKNLPTWRVDIPELWGLSWLLQVCFMSPTKQKKWKSHNSKVKLEVGNIIKKIVNSGIKGRIIPGRIPSPCYSNRNCDEVHQKGLLLTICGSFCKKLTTAVGYTWIIHTCNNGPEEPGVSSSTGSYTLGACVVLKQHTSQDWTSFWQTQQL